jgi:preprotein translocase subunit YajC
VISTLLAQANQAPPAGGGGFEALFKGFLGPMLMMFAIFYFLLIRPQQKKQRELQDWLKSLKKGDEVVTTGGLVGKISGITEHIVTLELQEKVRVRVLRSHIAGKPPAPPAPVQESK